jgi:hypothetical protein
MFFTPNASVVSVVHPMKLASFLMIQTTIPEHVSFGFMDVSPFSPELMAFSWTQFSSMSAMFDTFPFIPAVVMTFPVCGLCISQGNDPHQEGGKN